MITVWTRLYCRDCKEVIKARSRETAMVEWVRMVAEEKGWIEINIGGGLKRYLCPNCQQDYEPGDPGKQVPKGLKPVGRLPRDEAREVERNRKPLGRPTSKH